MGWIGRNSAIGLALAALLVTAACQTDTAEGDLPPVGEELVAVQKAECEGDGGIWTRGGLSSGFVCLQRTRDANQSCRTGSDCEGFCLARSRTCAPVTPFLGCHEVITDNGRAATVCVD